MPKHRNAKKTRQGPTRRMQPVIQAASLALFCGLLLSATLRAFFPADIFLRLDPSIAATTVLAGRKLLPSLLPGFAVLASALVLGRWFCGWVCPLGATIDATDTAFSRRGGPVPPPSAQKPARRLWKYTILAALLVAALFGLSLAFVASPLSLATRFYGLVLMPVLRTAGDAALAMGHAVGIDTGHALALPRFATTLFVAAFCGAILALGRWAPRFWCRYLCPAGALLALFSRAPLIRRHVNHDCTDCGRCARACPMHAIGPHGGNTAHAECITCRTCVDVCPENAVSFGAGSVGERKQPKVAGRETRRAILTGAGSGAALAGLATAGLWPGAGNEALARSPVPRPPGSVPEQLFLERCVRCGECMAVCPTNALQPIWLEAGTFGLFSPALTPTGGGPCSPHCNACGQVCPTGAIRDLMLEERRWARSGTAAVHRTLCLAWEWERSCMVCDEVCPYGAIEFVPGQGKVPVPRVRETRCAGCGACEHHCPAERAIRVRPFGALRLETGSFAEEGRNTGLTISLRKKEEAPPEMQKGDLPPGFDP